MNTLFYDDFEDINMRITFDLNLWKVSVCIISF